MIKQLTLLTVALLATHAVRATSSPTTPATSVKKPIVACPKIYKPVCCATRYGTFIIAANACICTRFRLGRVMSNMLRCSRPTCRCPRILRPVCCISRIYGRPRRFTTSNSCICSRCYRGRVLNNGRCKPVPIRSPSPTPTPSPSPSPRPRPCICTREFDPVCCVASDGKTRRTASNPCVCLNCGSGGRVLFKGRCPVIPPPPPPPTCICPAVFMPVCCRRKGAPADVTEGNDCECACGGGKVVGEGPCKPEPGSCICPAVEMPVCCKVKKDGRTVLMTKGNECLCSCAQGSVVSKGTCKEY